MKTLSFFLACLIFVSTSMQAAVNGRQLSNLNNEPANPDAFVEMPVQLTQEDITLLIDGREFTLRAGTAIVFEAAQTYNAKNLNVGQTVTVRVKYNVVVSKQTLIPAGAIGMATISEIRKPKGFGRGGKMEIQVQNVQAVDGQQVQVSGIPMTYEGENKKGTAWSVGIVAGLFTYGVGLLAGFIFKGKDAELRAGTTMNAAVASDTEVESQ
ncbi:MAG: hypothetical protein IPN76_22285 [Saprospiraceae bacterium]|nr:hypothetical protein [Saprospiraceae bacterium]